MHRYIHWALVAYVLFVFIQSLFFKFSGSEETEIIFGTIGDWMASIGGLSSLAPAFMQYGGYVIGGAELVASVLLIVPKTRFWGALMGIGVISGAIFFHLFTPLGVDPHGRRRWQYRRRRAVFYGLRGLGQLRYSYIFEPTGSCANSLSSLTLQR